MDKVIQESQSKIHVLPHQQYTSPLGFLSPSSVSSDPLHQFKQWLKEAVQADVSEPEAMSLSTVALGPTPFPSSRIVLLKTVDARGFVFFTNYTSRKSKELDANPAAALAFYWPSVHRSVRVVGTVEKVSEQESTEYFHSRPRESQLGAWASKQSSVVSEDDVAQRLDKIRERFDGREVDKPPFWGGWRVLPKEIEFWTGRPSRLHDRVRYLLDAEGKWTIERIAP
ncbi:pyridoxamine 5'-phosphate oxidase [Cylindrobasidium torrendii FP15055 ss-10]|uniref:pyridoxal 5'-phosphate synthase n=1 Tax=Cylindrobasidium torrendii FP15055 ss-10 TaxID=1314674 RepID=A0A0D7BDS4_9AGAR|nr:pyridoxamine 5'-phosphate oxidase [Cylindrobasidium torrendii FP15055 ss-10]